MAEAAFCFQHPTRIAKRKCYECSRPICPQCQKKWDHHLFCGSPCHETFLSRTSKKNPYGRYALYGTSVILVGVLIYFALLADAFYSSGTETAALAEMVPKMPVATDEEIHSQREEIHITRPVNGMKSPSQTIEVEGTAPDNSVVAMYLNGTLMESTVARTGGVYRFTNVVLTKPANVLQTRYYSDNGSSDSSTAIMVFYQSTIRESSNDFKFFQNSSDNISRGNLHLKELVLTFDGGSEANSCESILRTLEQFKVKSTVFLTGEFIEKYPELTRKIAQTQEVGNHTYSHHHLTTYAENYKQETAHQMTREELQNQLRKTEEVYFHVTGKRMAPIWRAPYGEHNLEIRKWAAELGYVHVAWTSDSKTRQNMDSLDWVPNSSYPGYFPAMLIKDRILSFGQNEKEQANGSIILMHLGTQREQHDRLDKWLPEIIRAFQKKEYRFITASELVDRQDLLPSIASS